MDPVFRLLYRAIRWAFPRNAAAPEGATILVAALGTSNVIGLAFLLRNRVQIAGWIAAEFEVAMVLLGALLYLAAISRFLLRGRWQQVVEGRSGSPSNVLAWAYVVASMLLVALAGRQA